MDPGDMRFRLSSLENKHRIALFEIEKRLVNLENSVHGAPSGLMDERIQELEDLLLLQQIEMSKMKEMSSGSAGAMPLQNFSGSAMEENAAEDNHDEIYNEISNIRKQVEYLTKTMQPDKAIHTKIDELHAKINEKADDSSALRRVQDLENEIRDMNRRINTMPVHNIDRDVSGRISRVEITLNNLQSKIDGLEKYFQKEIPEIDKRISSIEGSYKSYDDKGVYNEVQKILRG